MRFNRAATLSWLRTTPDVPVLIIGGGINGAGVLRELAINGVDALLVERSDFAGGASAASSRMIHGGLRYLEYGGFRLVRESLQERNRLLRNAPHAVFPLPTVIPLFSRWAGFGVAVRRFLGLGRPQPGGRRGAWLVRLGLALYTRYAGRDNPLPRPTFASARRARQTRPGLHVAAIGTATYHDAWNPSPERLNLEVITDALRAHAGARAVNYVGVVSHEQGTVTLCEELSGEMFSVRPRFVVNATGAWIDFTNQRLGLATRLIGGTKGSHMVVDHPGLYELLQGAEVFYENRDGRICLMLPLHGRVLVGTTDIRIDDPDTARCEAEEMAYLATAVRQVFPEIELPPSCVISRLCGVRPLPRTIAGPTAAISRDHACHEFLPATGRPFPVFAMVGGKWTTFRAFAEQVADRLLRELGRLRRAHSGHLPIGGGREHPGAGLARTRWIEDVARRTGLAPALIGSWLDRHGTTAAAIADHVQALPSEVRDADPVCGWHAGELDYICRHEAVQHLDDLLVRRTTIALFHRIDRDLVARCAAIAARALGWSPRRTDEEIERCARLLRERHGVRI